MTAPPPAAVGDALALPHLVRRPAAEPPAGARAPLVVLLHGLGSNEHALFPLRHALAPEFAVVCARGPLSVAGQPDGPGGRPLGPRAAGWFRVHPERAPGQRADADDVRASVDAVVRLAAGACDAYGADPGRVVVAGFSQGGMIALAALLERPEAFAGAAVLGGRLLAVARAQAAPPERLAGRRVLVVHGVDDRRVPVDDARAARDALTALPVALEYHEVPGRHAVTAEMRGLLARWAAAVAGVADRPADPAALERLRRAGELRKSRQDVQDVQD